MEENEAIVKAQTDEWFANLKIKKQKEERHRGANANVGLAEVGEDGKDKDGIGMVN